MLRTPGSFKYLEDSNEPPTLQKSNFFSNWVLHRLLVSTSAQQTGVLKLAYKSNINGTFNQPCVLTLAYKVFMWTYTICIYIILEKLLYLWTVVRLTA